MPGCALKENGKPGAERHYMTEAGFAVCTSLRQVAGRLVAPMSRTRQSVAAIPAGARVSLLLSKEHRIPHVARRLLG